MLTGERSRHAFNAHLSLEIPREAGGGTVITWENETDTPTPLGTHKPFDYRERLMSNSHLNLKGSPHTLLLRGGAILCSFPLSGSRDPSRYVLET